MIRRSVKRIAVFMSEINNVYFDVNIFNINNNNFKKLD